MLSSLLKDHQKQSQERRDQVDRKKTEALEAASQLGACLADSLNEEWGHMNIHFCADQLSHSRLICLFFSFSSIARAYSNQRKIDAEIRTLQSNVDQFTKQTNQWLHLMDGLNNSVKVLRRRAAGRMVQNIFKYFQVLKLFCFFHSHRNSVMSKIGPKALKMTWNWFPPHLNMRTKSANPNKVEAFDNTLFIIMYINYNRWWCFSHVSSV